MNPANARIPKSVFQKKGVNSNEKTRDKRGFLPEHSSNLTCVADRVEPAERRTCPDIGTPPVAECLLPCRCDPGGALHQPACTANQALWRAWGTAAKSEERRVGKEC